MIPFLPVLLTKLGKLLEEDDTPLNVLDNAGVDSTLRLETCPYV
jgi:hypothetical protein